MRRTARRVWLDGTGRSAALDAAFAGGAMRAMTTLKIMSYISVAFSILAGCATPSAEEESQASTSALELSRGPTVPAALAGPTGNGLDFELNATGVQIYQCQSTSAGFAWVFQAPEANLFDDDGALKATHFAGPTWKSIDGSSVVGTKLAAVTVSASAIPELLLQATSHAGTGKMSPVTYIQRLDTVGGIAPSSGCDDAHWGATARVDYKATYVFYKASTSNACNSHAGRDGSDDRGPVTERGD
jgi:hypothetical protein